MVGSLLLAAALAPWIYNVGMTLAEVTATKDTNAVLDWLGRAAERSRDDFGRFFDRALLLAAVVLLVPLWRSLHRGARHCDTPWALWRSRGGVVEGAGQPLQPNRWGVWHGLLGFTLGAGGLLLVGASLVWAGFFEWRSLDPGRTDWRGLAEAALPTALVVAVLEETLFRGVLLGVFLRAMRPRAALIGLSLFFAAVHFLDAPAGVEVPDPEAADAGLVMLSAIGMHFLHPGSFMAEFVMLFAVGLVLAVARYRTASLWLPVGLHGGWILGQSVFGEATRVPTALPEWAGWLVGPSLQAGLLPLLAMLITGLVVTLGTAGRPTAPVRAEA